MKRTLHARDGPPWWMRLLIQYRYQVLGIILLVLLVGGLAWGHNPVEVEGVFILQ